MFIIEWKEGTVEHRLKADTENDLMWLLCQLANRMITNDTIVISKVGK